jgi:predicted nucleic acid-binding protein
MNQNNQKKYLLLDTNIIEYLDKDGFKEKIQEILRTSVQEGLEIALSEYTFFEFLDGANVKKEYGLNRLVGNFNIFGVDRNVLAAAAHLGTYYKDHDDELKKIGPGDKIIGATAILNQCILLTANGRDFPEPFFKEVNRILIEYELKKQPKALYVYFKDYEFDYLENLTEERISEMKLLREKELNKNKK